MLVFSSISELLENLKIDFFLNQFKNNCLKSILKEIFSSDIHNREVFFLIISLNIIYFKNFPKKSFFLKKILLLKSESRQFIMSINILNEFLKF